MTAVSQNPPFSAEYEFHTERDGGCPLMGGELMSASDPKRTLSLLLHSGFFALGLAASSIG